MTIQKIKKAINSKALTLYTDGGGFQWLGDGSAAYLMDRKLDLTADNLLAILDIDPDKRADYSVRDIRTPPAFIDQCPQEDADEPLTYRMTVMHGADPIEIYLTDDRQIVMIQGRYTAPAIPKEEPPAYVLRRSQNPNGELYRPIVCVFADILCCALIVPIHSSVAVNILRTMSYFLSNGVRYVAEDDARGTDSDK